jgi:two-component system sensor histidine kinase RegB
MWIHLYGMWVAFSVAAAFIVYFLLRIRRALGQREAELEAARSLAARHDKLASLGTLAAGAAHELATPLGTIAVAAKELERELGKSGSAATAAMEDVQLIRRQVARCRAVLEQLGREAGESGGESLVETTSTALLASAQEGLCGAARLHIEIGDELRTLPLRLPLRSLAQALRALFKNALEASADSLPVRVELRRSGPQLEIAVHDRGAGIAPLLLQRIGEPFFTTKEPGSGMGLGVFLCRAVVESLGGELHYLSTVGSGTLATLRLPLGSVLSPTGPAR